MIDPDAILAAIEELPPMQSTDERDYLGASILGEACQRKLWLQFHKYVEPEQFSSRMLRLLYRGQREEGMFEMYLRETGFTIIENCMSQTRWTDGFMSGAGDGVVEKNGERYCVEYKTHSLAQFKTLTRGELIITHPKHFTQCQVNALKFNCVGAIYLAVNKDNDELFCDVIALDNEFANQELAKGEYVTMADKAPDRIASKPTSHLCKFCHAKNVCFGFDQPRINCRSCTSATKHRETGKFGCGKIEESGSIEQRSSNDHLPESGSCESHSWNPFFVQEFYGHSPIEFFPTERAVKYKRQDGTEFINGAEPFGIPSKKLVL